MKFRKTTAKTVAADLRAFATYLESTNAEASYREAAALRLNEILDDFSSEDSFGTEGQHDPRGARR